MSEKHKCCATVQGEYSHSYTCGRAAKHEREGKWYCGTHDPVAVKARRDASAAKWQEQWEAMRLRREQDRQRQEYERKCVNALRGIDDPETWVAEVRRVLERCASVIDAHVFQVSGTGHAAHAKKVLAEVEALLTPPPAPHGGGTSQDASGG